MCEYKAIALPAINILLAVIILLLLYFLIVKVCLCEADQANSSSLPDNIFPPLLK